MDQKMVSIQNQKIVNMINLLEQFKAEDGKGLTPMDVDWLERLLKDGIKELKMFIDYDDFYDNLNKSSNE